MAPSAGPAQGSADLRCPACGAALANASSFRGVDRLHRTRGSFEVVCCQACGSGLTLPAAAQTELASFYPREYGPYEGGGGAIIRRISLAIRWYQIRRALSRTPLKALSPIGKGRMIDVGCGRGDLAAELIRRGWHAVGVEPSASACAVAQARGVDVRQGTLADVTLEPEAYDAAVFQHSLEHTTDVMHDLASVAHALRPGGLVLVTVPNFDSWQRHRFADRWYHLDLPRHRCHFTARGLRKALERAGLQVESMTTSTSTVGLPATVQYALAGRCLFPGGLGLRIASGLCVLTLPFARVVNAFSGGDQLHAVARLPS